MQIKTLPFYFKSHPQPDNGGYPHILPFNLIFDEELKMFRQLSSPDLNTILEDVYKKGSLVDGSLSDESGNHYVSKIMNYITDNFPLNNDTKILEIGCGSGGLLKEFKKIGIKNLTGIEPGDHNFLDGLEGVKLLNDFYPTKQFQEKVNLIIHAAVLEHLENAYDFLKAQHDQLEDNGKIIFFVPNVEPFLQDNDCSIFIHEHFNYFTTESICKLMYKLNLNIDDISVIDGIFAVTVTKTNSPNKQQIFNKFNYESFFEKVESNLIKRKIILKQYKETEIALYVPGRALNTMFLLDMPDVRLVDDNKEIHNKYLPYFRNKVESLEMIIKNPPKVILIFSRTFGHLIKNKCEAYSELANTKIYSVEEI